ncbi:hypothetical protein D3C86_1416680 [compost metagenome]
MWQAHRSVHIILNLSSAAFSAPDTHFIHRTIERTWGSRFGPAAQFERSSGIAHTTYSATHDIFCTYTFTVDVQFHGIFICTIPGSRNMIPLTDGQFPGISIGYAGVIGAIHTEEGQVVVV